MSAPNMPLDALPDAPPDALSDPLPDFLSDEEECGEADEELDAYPLDPDHPDQIALRTRGAIILRRLARIEADLATQAGAEAAELAMVKRAHAKAKATIAKREDWYLRELDAISRLLVYPRGAKSLATGAGRIGRKDVSAKLVVDDRAQLVAWCKANLPTALIPKVSEDIKLPDVAKHLLETGEEADGTHVAAAHTILSYKIGLDA